jgi:hypothetical protein
LLRGLLDELSRHAPERLAAPRCEAGDAAALADELSWLTADRAALTLTAKPRRGATLLAAALLLGGMGLTTACDTGDNEGYENECAADISDQHFADIIEGNPGLTDDEIAAAEAGYDAYPKPAKHDMMNRLCEMKAEQIATYITAAFEQGDDDNDSAATDDDSAADDDATPPADDDASIDDDAEAYKGVTF